VFAIGRLERVLRLVPFGFGTTVLSQRRINVFIFSRSLSSNEKERLQTVSCLDVFFELHYRFPTSANATFSLTSDSFLVSSIFFWSILDFITKFVLHLVLCD
jgi:hypothetical protein